MKTTYEGLEVLPTAITNIIQQFVKVCMDYRRLDAGSRLNHMRVTDWRRAMIEAEASVKTARAMVVALFGEQGEDEVVRELLPTDFKFPGSSDEKDIPEPVRHPIGSEFRRIEDERAEIARHPWH